jgi:hypothetical protein
MASDNKITLEEITNLHRVMQTNPANDRGNDKKEQNRKSRPPAKPINADKTLEQELEADNSGDFGDPDFHVIDYNA